VRGTLVDRKEVIELALTDLVALAATVSVAEVGGVPRR
jgi:hypothetical protein